MSQPSVEVVVLHANDAERAEQGGADLLHLCSFVGDEARSVAPVEVSAVVRATDLPVRVTLRLSEGLTTQGGELARLRGLAGDYLSLGVDGFVLGFLTRDLDIDVEVCTALVEAFDGAAWNFDRTFDQTLEPDRAWRQLRSLPGLDGVHTAGAALGMDAGLDDLLNLLARRPEVAPLAVAAGGVRAEHVPWLVRSGVQRLHLASAVRPGGSWSKSFVDPGFVRSWRTLLDDAIRRTRPPRQDAG
ncbi:MAG: copper homeostasis protein CutC [Nocardioidaceae bacterium]